jgi:hypothetical protein
MDGEPGRRRARHDLFSEALSYDRRIEYHLDLATLLEHRSRPIAPAF